MGPHAIQKMTKWQEAISKIRCGSDGCAWGWGPTRSKK
jgi:hypothetical protein